MSINIGRRDRAGRSRAGGRHSPLHAAALLLLANASVALGQVPQSAPAGDPIDDTWRYLVELFRMILGM